MFRCLSKEFCDLRCKHDTVLTNTYQEQVKVEDSVGDCYRLFKNACDLDSGTAVLDIRKHQNFLLKGLEHLAQSYECLDASRPWLCYWIVHSLEILNIPIPAHIASRVAQFLGRCQNSVEGGFGGGPQQQAHLAPTFAAVNALCILGTEEAYNVIDRKKLRKFLLSRKLSDGSFTMHEGGEVDIRGAYCVASVARLTNIVCSEMFDGTAEWIVRCQSYEGGFAGRPGLEAHGGYSFCGLAALILLRKEHLCDISALLRWTAFKQMSFEGGFQGRTNKLVDGCYSFWQGGAFPLLHMVLSKQGDTELNAEKWMFHQGALQEYLLICCQNPNGGLIDKPGKSRDFYHTCYCLSGLSVAQHFSEGRLEKPFIIGSAENEVNATHPIFNIGFDAVTEAHRFFGSLPTLTVSSEDTMT